jgi:uncharacterized protein (PEP-CTERM system associated)
MISAGANRRRCGLLLIVLGLPAGVRSAEWTVVPTLRLREAYSDNIMLAPAAQAQGEFSTEVAPGLSVTATGPRLVLSFDYSLQRVAYSHQPDRNSQELAGSLHAEAVPDWLYLDAHDSISQQNISAFGQQRIDKSQISANNETVHTTSISPYLQHLIRGFAMLQLRHNYDHVGSARLLDVRSNDSSLRLTRDNGGQGWTWQLYADHKTIDDASLAPVTMDDASLTLNFPLNSRMAVFATGGYENNDYHSLGTQPHGRYWNSGVSWTPSPRTSVTASIGRRYFGRTQALDASYRMRNMFWTLSYNVDITTSHDQFLNLPPTGLGDFLNQLWLTRIPDPQVRQQTIKAFLGLSQLLGQTGNVNYFSHRYFLQKQWHLSTVYSGSRSALTLGWSSTGRTAQTASEVDSLLLGPGQLNLEDRTRQNALQAGWNWRMSARDNLNVSASTNAVHSLSTGRKDRNNALVLNLTRQLQPKVSLSADLRHVNHSSNAGGNYRENGASVSLSMQF